MQLNTMKTAVALAAVVVIATGAAAQGQVAPANDQSPAVFDVNGEKIYAAQIRMTMSNIAAQFAGQGEEPDQHEVVQMATQRVIEQKLMAQEARRQGIQVDELRVAEMMKQLDDQAGGRSALEQKLNAGGATIEQIEILITEMDLSRTLIATKIIPTVEVTDEEVAAFYADNPDTFKVPETVHARHIVFAVPQNGDEATAAAALAKAENARERALAGEDFAALARELSEGPTAEDGGDLGFFPHAMMEPNIANAAFALEPGQISEVVRTPYGYHVVKVEEKKPAGKPSLEEVQEQTRAMLEQQKTARKVTELLQVLGEKAEVTSLFPTPSQAAAPGENQ